MRRQCLAIRAIAGEHDSTRFCKRDNQRIDGGPLAGFSAKLRSTSDDIF